VSGYNNFDCPQKKRFCLLKRCRERLIERGSLCSSIVVRLLIDSNKMVFRVTSCVGEAVAFKPLKNSTGFTGMVLRCVSTNLRESVCEVMNRSANVQKTSRDMNVLLMLLLLGPLLLKPAVNL
jgi:hypothetical protein